jgi:hypothetical protein
MRTHHSSTLIELTTMGLVFSGNAKVKKEIHEVAPHTNNTRNNET